MSKRKTPLPDRWNFDRWRNGRRLDPPLGHKVGVHWGYLLTLEYHLREIEKNLAITENDMVAMQRHIAELSGDEPPDFSDTVYLALARDFVRNMEFILAEIRRTEKWPHGDHPDWPQQQVTFLDRSPPQAAERSKPQDDDPDAPF